MTESNKRSDADAVLTSVRRIVTRQLSAEELGAPPPVQPETRDAPEHEPQRLLLTPSLRVSETPPVIVAEPASPTGAFDRTTLEERIAELERAVGAAADDFEPDGSETVDEETPHRFFHDVPKVAKPPKPVVAEAPMVLDAPEEPQEVTAPVPFPGASRRPDPVTDVGDEDVRQAGDAVDMADASLIDEDMLREIVAEIVRAELQGELGERITRNVRKLVRREIHRALMSRDFS